MKTLFIDCNPQFELVFRRVYRTDDPKVDVNNTPFQSADLPRMLNGYGICIDDHSYMPTEVMKECRSLKHIVFCGTGASSYMNVAELRERGIRVHTIKGYGDTAVAEHTIALMLASCRDVARMDREIRAGVWSTREGVQLAGKILGVIGLGGIGREVARIGRGLGMQVLAWNRTPIAGETLVALDELLTRPIGQGDIFANANTIILMGRVKEGGRLGRALAIPKHRGSACGDQVLPYRITDRGLVFD